MPGVALQGVFRNPLAEPALLGITNGAIVGVLGVMAGGLAALGTWILPLGALAAVYADHVVVLGVGEVKADGSLSEVFQTTILEEVFQTKFYVTDHP